MNKKYFIALLFLALSALPLCAEGGRQGNSLIPRPVQCQPGQGSYTFTPASSFVVEDEAQAQVARLMAALFDQAAGFLPQIRVGAGEGDIVFTTDPALKSEAYRLQIAPQGIRVQAADVRGFFYATQTLRTLLPKEIEGNGSAGVRWSVPSQTIYDEPRFPYRGLMLDAARFFIPKQYVLRLIDCMAMLKLNKLHFHLTDDNGWRIEIKRYPKLTSVGAWRVDREELPFPARANAQPGEPTPVGGYYTQNDIREIVAYAADRQVEVIPEIDMPAHSNAALAAYPQYACPVVKKYIGVLPGIGGAHADIIYCAGNDSTYAFLQNIIDEVAALFPSRYFHIGGDEAWKTHWKTCPLCQQRMKQEGISDEEHLQGYFINRMAAYVRSLGKEVMGWDELTNSRLPEGAIIYGWQGYGQAALKAAARGHRFVMTPARILYMIRYQGPQWFEPLTYFGNNTLKDVYTYEPTAAKNWKPQYDRLLMGVQASMWTEFCRSARDVEYQLFPRLTALAEVAWSRPEQKDWAGYLQALDKLVPHLEQKGVTVARSMYNIQHTVRPVQGKLQVTLECIRPDVEIRYTTDGSEPTPSSPRYEQPVLVEQGQDRLKCATFKQESIAGQVLDLSFRWNKATAKPIVDGREGQYVLTNGVRGSRKQTDFEWCSWAKSDTVKFVVDLLQQTQLKSVSLGAITNSGMAVHKPKFVGVELSDDGVNYRQAGSRRFSADECFATGTFVEDIRVDVRKCKARYVRITAAGAGKCPQEHVRPGQEARLYFDEVMID